MVKVLIRRPPRLQPPALPHGQLELRSPPELTENTGSGMANMLMFLPMVAGGGAMAFMVVGQGTRPITIVAGVLYAVSMVGMMLGQLGRGSSEKRRQLDTERRDYSRYLAQSRAQVRRAVSRQHEAVTWRNPAPEDLLSMTMSRRLWERRPTDGDFGMVRLGVGPQQLAVSLVTPQAKPIEDLEPMSAGALRRFVQTHSTVPDLPLTLAVRSFGRIFLRGERDCTLPAVRAMLAHLAVFHAPDDVVLAVCAPPERIADWDWVKWLPHALHPTDSDATGPIRLVVGGLGDVERLLPELARRSRVTETASSAVPHVVIVVDGTAAAESSSLDSVDLDGVTLIDLAGWLPGEDGDRSLTLKITTDEVLRLVRDSTGEQIGQPLGRADQLSRQTAEAIARRLAPIRTSAAADPEDALSQDRGLLQLLGLGDPDRINPADGWRYQPVRDRLRVPIGVGPAGTLVDLDIKEASQNGMGPHGLVVGATGSGKSELLRTLVLGLALKNSPESLNFILVDFKGGATFAPLIDLPHTSAVITNLAADLSLVDRMRDAIDGELNRRQEVLRDAGNYESLVKYEQARESGAALPSLPSLFIVVDEFSELLAVKPDFIELFIQIGRIGRSLGVHLLLASQRLEEGRLRGLDTYLSYRVGLRTFSGLESRVVLGVTDAVDLPTAPGHGYLKTDTSTMVRFKAAYVSGPHLAMDPASMAGGSGHQVLPYGVRYLDPAYAQQPAPKRLVDPNADSVLDVVVRRLVGHGAEAHRVWLPPLADPVTLDALLPGLVIDPHRGLTPAGWPGNGTLVLPIGQVDRPFDQRRDPLGINLSGAGGHVAVVGGPQSGKSTVLRDLIAATALTHTPEEVQFYCLDFGGSTLTQLRGLPHVGSVAGRMTPDLVRRTVAEMTSLLARREELFQTRGIDSMAAYRRLKQDGQIPEDPYGDVFLVVDGWGILRSDFEALEAQITALAAGGLGYGLHVVVSAQRWMEIRPTLRDLIGTRIELRLGDPSESEVDRPAAANVPADAPGRGITPERLAFLSALPRIDGDNRVATLSDGIRHLVDAVAGAWPGLRAPAVRLLPTQLSSSMLPPAPYGDNLVVPIGIDEIALEPVYLDLGAEPHFVVLGDTGSGKTNLLRLIALQIASRYTPDQAKIVLFDYRRGLLDVADLPNTLAHGFSSAHGPAIIGQVVSGLQKRLPPADISREQLRARNWWQGPELFVLVDDYDLVAVGSGNPVLPLLDLLAQARDIGLHLIVARATGGAGRAMFEPVMQRLRESGTPALIMSGSRDEGGLFENVKPEPMPPGRGRLVNRREVLLVQTAELDLSGGNP